MAIFQQFGTELGAIREGYDRALDLIREKLNDPEECERLKRGALKRWEDGLQVYEGATWEKTEEEIIIDIDEELEDAMNYGSVWHVKQGNVRY